MDPIKWIQETRRIHGICPCCEQVFRLSDATIYTREPPPRTPFDRLEAARARLAREMDRFELRRTEVLDAQREAGQRQARARLKRISPEFVGRGIDPQDVRVIFDPVRYVVFKGMSRDTVKSVELVDEEPSSKPRERLLRSLEDTIRRGNVEWCTWRVDEDGGICKG